ncbi:hypothetical protein SAMN05660297_01110 [Natronincola peptidivorans]|uniref:Uncharacterized protein n=1 Tax=Natronincola peptidivorans TaxID=426128 RepID=A0A1I0AYJ3_9FIRM|nr:hypothetical protein [Natronincola peptidivorans]SES98872.1 hypothetical protein SAMN05660297_01110 [Natronincola peptidivorans]
MGEDRWGTEQQKRNNEEDKDKKPFDIEKYIQIALIIGIILIASMRFGLLPRANVVNSTGNSLNQMAVEYYLDKYGQEAGAEEITTNTRNFGCHREIYVYRDGELVMRMGYANGRMYEIQ